MILTVASACRAPGYLHTLAARTQRADPETYGVPCTASPSKCGWLATVAAPNMGQH
eukprot:CAMPEP_0179316068 /NCGR_PEP_ID=MMETSP0797-20121207/55462_1 /TAXON_ID=47934 /ORGANISM="Dinophysis acuminata, Strain DAEP01" /LENGTH=55 /DNA_ID=CAMNT_0021026763 /DNA_START=42 /DNA_END=209 /DNA_ORIENTATION=-